MDPPSPSRDTSEETFESMNPVEVPETPSIEEAVSLQQPDPTNAHSKSPESALKKLTSPFRRLSSERVKTLSEDGTPDRRVSPSKPGIGESKKQKMKKRAGALVRKISQFRSRKGSTSPTPNSQGDKEPHDEHDDDSGSQYGSVEDVEIKETTSEGNPPPHAETPPRSESPSHAESSPHRESPPPHTESPPHKDSPSHEEAPPHVDSPPHKESPPLMESPPHAGASSSTPPPPVKVDGEPKLPDIALVAVEHPVSTLPFAKSTWKKKEPQIQKPVETIGPEDSLRKRISADEPNESPGNSSPTEEEIQPLASSELEKVVRLAKTHLSSGVQEPKPVSRSSSPLPGPSSAHQSEAIKEKRPEGKISEEAGPSSSGLQAGGNIEPRMGPHGDLIQEEPSTSAGPSSASGTTAPLQHGPDARKEHLYKILVIGELGTGKTSIIKRYVHQFFSQHYRATIGVDFALKVMTFDEETTVRLQLWDIAGQERFGNMTRVYYKEAVGAFIVFDCTRPATFDAIMKWKNDLDSKVQLPDGSNVPCVLLANKCDLHKEGIINNFQAMEDYCRQKGFVGWFETSAKENINIEEAMKALVRHILRKDLVIEGNADDDRLTVTDETHALPPKKCAC